MAIIGVCYLCGRLVNDDGRGDCEPQEDHVLPHTLGGVQTRPVHRWCNLVKGTKTAQEAQLLIAAHFRAGTAPLCLGYL